MITADLSPTIIITRRDYTLQNYPEHKAERSTIANKSRNTINECIADQCK
ncbi:hypothetical protein KRX19_11405 [Cardiobacteriaceae bacterium TAE3-ERU3]|nr:hypothetical protein [Cardiobacteriaceae bacterium TAE3-ERU3]